MSQSTLRGRDTWMKLDLLPTRKDLDKNSGANTKVQHVTLTYLNTWPWVLVSGVGVGGGYGADWRVPSWLMPSFSQPISYHL